MSSSVEMKWKPAPCCSIAARVAASLSARAMVAYGGRCSNTASPGSAGRSCQTSSSRSTSVRKRTPFADSASASRRAPARPSTRASTATVWPADRFAASQSTCSWLAAPGIFISAMSVPASSVSAWVQ